MKDPPFLMGKSVNPLFVMAIFNSYVSLPEGNKKNNNKQDLL
jgi:hypothetical protein